LGGSRFRGANTWFRASYYRLAFFNKLLERNEPFFKKFPNHCLEVFEGGQAAFLEDPDRFEKSLRRFLREKCTIRP
jgi:hypothetical protein